MTPFYTDDWLTLYGGDCRAVLAELPADSVDCVVTSPPYWGLRDYGTATWIGGDEACDHLAVGPGRAQRPAGGLTGGTAHVDAGTVKGGDCGRCGATRSDSQLGLERTPEEYVANMVAVFAEVRRVLKPSGTCWLNLGSSYMASGERPEKGRGWAEYDIKRTKIASRGSGPTPSLSPERAPAYGSDGKAPSGSTDLGSAYPDLCGGCLDDYLIHLRRTLGTRPPVAPDEQPLSQTVRDSEPGDFEQASPDALLLASQESTTLQSWTQQRAPCLRCDSRASALSAARSSSDDAQESARSSWLNYTFKPKDMVPIPWMVAMALQADGWYLRSDIIWAKSNPMPESVTDRPTKAHEYLFLLTKSARYYFDADAVREPHVRLWDGSKPNGRSLAGGSDYTVQAGAPTAHVRQEAAIEPNPAGRNIRSVWTIATRPYPGAHFAVFPPELPERCIKAGSSERGVCPECGAPWERVVERVPVPRDLTAHRGTSQWAEGATTRNDTDLTRSGQEAAKWKAANPDKLLGWRPTCAHTAEPVPAVILDPFAGSGTVGMVANRLLAPRHPHRPQPRVPQAADEAQRADAARTFGMTTREASMTPINEAAERQRALLESNRRWQHDTRTHATRRQFFIEGALWASERQASEAAPSLLQERDRHSHKVNAGCFPSCPAHYSREAAPSPDPALRWAYDRLRPYDHPPACTPTHCSCGWVEFVKAIVAPSLLQERDRLAERLYAALWDERVVLDAGIKGFDERRYRAAAKRIDARLSTQPSTELAPEPCSFVAYGYRCRRPKGHTEPHAAAPIEPAQGGTE